MDAREIYLDHAATTPLRPEVAEAMARVEAEGFGNPSSPHAVGRRARRLLEESRERILFLLGARPTGVDRDRLVFTSGATEANRLGILGPRPRTTGAVASSHRDHPGLRAAVRDLGDRGHHVLDLPLSAAGRIAPAVVAAAAASPGLSVLSATLGCGQTGTLEDLAGLHAAAERLRAAVADKARVAVATSRPASLLGLARWAADTVRAGDATLLGGTTATIEGGGRRELWWTGGVAVVTDGQALLAHDGVPGGDDWLFAVGRPDLVVADRGFAGAALRAGVETIAWADLDAPALALAAARGRPVVLVPLAERRPAAAYEAALGVLGAPPEPTSLG